MRKIENKFKEAMQNIEKNMTNSTILLGSNRKYRRGKFSKETEISVTRVFYTDLNMED